MAGHDAPPALLPPGTVPTPAQVRAAAGVASRVGVVGPLVVGGGAAVLWERWAVVGAVVLLVVVGVLLVLARRAGVAAGPRLARVVHDEAALLHLPGPARVTWGPGAASVVPAPGASVVQLSVLARTYLPASSFAAAAASALVGAAVHPPHVRRLQVLAQQACAGGRWLMTPRERRRLVAVWAAGLGPTTAAELTRVAQRFPGVDVHRAAAHEVVLGLAWHAFLLDAVPRGEGTDRAAWETWWGRVVAGEWEPLCRWYAGHPPTDVGARFVLALVPPGADLLAPGRPPGAAWGADDGAAWAVDPPAPDEVDRVLWRRPGRVTRALVRRAAAGAARVVPPYPLAPPGQG